MRSFHDQSWAPEPADRDSVTQLYLKPQPVIAYVPATPQAPVRRPQRISPTLLGVGFATICVLVGITIGSMIAFSGRSAVAAPSVRIPHVVAPAPTPTITVTSLAPPARAIVRVESEPAGAAVMLVDDGKSSPVGKTPIEVQLDGSRGYELVVTLDGHETQIVHVEPATTPHVAVVLPAAEQAPAPTPVAVHHHHAVRKSGAR